jgi:amino acid transporter
MEARADREGLRSGALSTVEAMIVSMGFMAPSVAMFFNTPFIAQFAGRKERENFSIVRHAVIPLVATAAVCLPIRGLLYPVPDPPYNLWPYLLAAWVLIGLVILFVISRRRPELIEALGTAFSEAGVDEPDTTQEDVRRREDRGAAQSKETTE